MTPATRLLALCATLLAACSGGGQEPSVAFVQPAGEAWTNGTLRIQLRADTATSVELLADGAPLATLSPPFVHDWDTSGVAEGAHVLSARGTFPIQGGPAQGREVVVDGAPVTVHVDRTPPTVALRRPEPGDQAAWVGTAIEVRFSEPTAGTVTFEASGTALAPGSAVQASRLDDGWGIAFTPSQPVQVPGGLVITLLPGITDRAGNALALPGDSWAFGYQATARRVVAEGYWVKAAEPGLVRDPTGRLLLAWTEMGNPDSPLTSWLATDADGFVQRQAVPAAATGLAVAPDGTRHLACNGVGYLAVDVYKSAAPEWVNLGRASAPSPPVDGLIAVDSQGVPWVASRAGLWNAGAEVSVSRYSGGTWSQVGSPLGAGPGWSGYPNFLGIDGTGAPVMAWIQIDHTSGILEQILSRFDGVSWQEVPFPTGFAYGVYAMDAAGAPLIAAGGASCTAQVHRWNGTAWDPVGEAVPTCNVMALAVDGQGGLWLAAREGDTAVRRLEAGTFVTVHRGPPQWWPSLAVDAAGEPWLAGSPDSETLYVFGPNR